MIKTKFYILNKSKKLTSSTWLFIVRLGIENDEASCTKTSWNQSYFAIYF